MGNNGREPEKDRVPTVVGIGASAGGLSALKTFFSEVPADSGLAFVVVVHLSPDHESHMESLLQRHAKIPVRQITQTVPLETDHVYIIPPGANLEAVDSHIRITELQHDRRKRAPVDHFFHTLAEVHDGHAVAVVLTGTGNDGALGIKAVKENGGVTIVQDPRDAEFDAMPQAAIATGLVDLILPLSEIPGAVLRIVQTEPRVEVLDGDSGDSDPLLHKILGQIRARTGRDFTRYKRSTIMRRIARRMQLRCVDELAEYLEILRSEPEEVRSLSDDFLITVTSFFRDPEVFGKLESEYLPKIFDRKGSRNDEVRVWCVGCASGEEAYTLAILLMEESDRQDSSARLKVFASDLHEGAIERARQGFFPENIVSEMSPERLNRFFERVDNAYRIRKEVRERVIFTPHNLLSDPPFSRLDLISCRNLLIYLERRGQQEVAELFHYALRPGGFLVVGGSEALGRPELFVVEDDKAAIYRKRDVPAPDSRFPVFPPTGQHIAKKPAPASPPADERPASYGSLHHELLEVYGPPSFLVGPDDRVLNVTGSAGRYMNVPDGELTSSPFLLVREELQLELRTAVSGARRNPERGGIRTRPIPMDANGKTRHVVLRVGPHPDAEQAGFVVVVFEEVDADLPVSGKPDSDGSLENSQEHRLQEELSDLRQRLKDVFEDYETGQEEMRASNEELQSANEEFRSTLEELETSKEELQSMNEELQTANQENRHKVEELAQLNDDLQNLFSSTDIATLFLDTKLRIMRFTPQLRNLFNIRQSDQARPISDITHKLDYETLVDDATKVVKGDAALLERELQDADGRFYFARVLPYCSSTEVIEGVVITFLDVTPVKRARAALRQSEEVHRQAIEAGSVGTWELDPASKELLISAKLAELLGCEAEQQSIPWDQWIEKVHAESRSRVEEALKPSRDDSQPIECTLRIASDNGWRWLYCRGDAVEEAGQIKLLGASIDLTHLKLVEDTLRLKTQELRDEAARRELFIATLGHEIRNPLAALDGAVRLVEEGVVEVDDMFPKLVSHVRRLVSLVDELLTISRIARGKVTLHKNVIDLVKALRAAAQSNAELIRDKNLELTMKLPEALPIEGDAIRLEQVFANLISNAAKYTHEGGAIEVLVTKKGGKIVTEVRDNGCGIDETQMESIFEPFVQNVPDSDGLGLGLPLARGLVRLHGGTLSVSSPGPGEGSVFTVKIPVGKLKQKKEDTDRESNESVRGLRVLFVDDLPDAADALGLLLRTEGAETKCAYTGEEAVEIAKQWKPDVAVIDLGLPDITGYEVASQVRAEHSETLLLALTGFANDETAEKALQAGFAERLVKPVDYNKLRRVLARHRANLHH